MLRLGVLAVIDSARAVTSEMTIRASRMRVESSASQGKQRPYIALARELQPPEAHPQQKLSARYASSLDGDGVNRSQATMQDDANRIAPCQANSVINRCVRRRESMAKEMSKSPAARTLSNSAVR